MSSMQVASPQAGNFNWRKRLRQDSGSGSETESKAPKLQWNYIKLESESPPPSEEDSESVYSLQGQETEFCKDTSDTDSSDSWSSYSVDVGNILMRVEYEVDSDCDKTEKFVFGDGGSSSGSEGVVETATDLLVATLCDSDLAIWADTEDSKSGYSTDSELGRADYWTCIQCKNKNNNPLFRYCEKCYQIRKNFFPPRPKGKKKKKVLDKPSTSTESENRLLPALSQDSGIATSLSQESIDLMDLGKIKIPENLLYSKPSSSSLVSLDLVRTDQKDDNMCITCMNNQKDAVFIHSGPVHMCCCYKCAMRVWTECKRCPVCNRKVSNVKRVK